MHPEIEVASGRLVMIVLGAGLSAERDDRPIAYRLAQALDRELDDLVEGPSGTMRAAVCTDLWYLNEASVRSAPTIAIGGPDRNALTAHATQRFARRHGEEGRWVVQTPEDDGDLAALLWGDSAEDTEAAVRCFASGMLGEFAEACVLQASRGG